MRASRLPFVLALGSIAILPPGAAGQTAPRARWGAPDLQGVWNHAERDQLTEDEVTAINAAQRSTAGVGARRAVWWERALSDGRTSMIIDPPTGRIPYTDEARGRLDARPPPGTDGPEDRSLAERCLSYGIPRLGGPYSQNIHIAQTPDHLLLLHEMTHEFRIIPLDGRPHLPAGVTQWLGDSRGRWEGDTLVVETTRVDRRQRYRGLSQGGVRLVERFTRVDRDTLRYEVTFHDPTLWTQPWTARLSMPPTAGPMFEFACHEGNVGMTAMLETARDTAAAAR